MLYLTPCPGDNLSGGVTEVWVWVTIQFCTNVGSDISGSESETMQLEVRPIAPQSPYQCIHQVWPKLDSTSNNSSGACFLTDSRQLRLLAVMVIVFSTSLWSPYPSDGNLQVNSSRGSGECWLGSLFPSRAEQDRGYILAVIDGMAPSTCRTTKQH